MYSGTYDLPFADNNLCKFPFRYGLLGTENYQISRILSSPGEKMDKYNTQTSGPEKELRKLWDVASSPWEKDILPDATCLGRARASLVDKLPQSGLGLEDTQNHLFKDIVTGLNASSLSPNYYGFVTGGVTPAALIADNIVSAYDQNVQVHFPEQTIATEVEARALDLLLDLLDLDRETWSGGTFTTGATASNVLGLALGREFVLRKATEKQGGEVKSVGEHGMLEVLKAGHLEGLQVLTTMPHSSLTKAAGIVGIGRNCVKSICQTDDPLKFDLNRLRHECAKSDIATILAISCGEVNTGHFATSGIEELQQIRRISDEHDVWIHVDGAFGIFTRILENGGDFDALKRGCEGLELADSITGDAHKLLNVPYDCGFFFSRHKNLSEQVFQNGNAAYLSAGAQASIPSPLNIGIENSRRFRALPVYATLCAYGRDGYRNMLEEQIRLARAIASFLFDHPGYVVLPAARTKEELLKATFMIVLFQAKSEKLNGELVKRINGTSRMYVSGTSWDGKPTSRIAISNWRADEKRDFAVVKDVLEGLVDR